MLRLKLADESGPATLIRAGQALGIQPGETFAFGRLDLLRPAEEKALTIHDLDFGTLHVPAETVVSVWSLPDHLEISGFERLQKTADAAAFGDKRAARRLELALPLSHKSIRDALRDSPRSAGAPRLRTMLTLFDDVPKLSPKSEAAEGELNLLELRER